MHYVIIGNSAAGVGAVEGIRRIDTEGKITVISSENYHTYSRPLISYYLQGKIDGQRMKYRPDGFYAANGCDVLLGRTVVSINKDDKSIVLDGGQVLPYDKLLVATGSSAFVPPFEGLDKVADKFTFMSLDDAKGIKGKINNKTRVLIIGAGLIGLKCAEGIASKAAEITVFDLSTQILSSILDDESAGLVQKHIENQGVGFVLRNSVQRFEKGRAFLQNGDVIDFDLLVLAVGVRPNIRLFSDAGGAVNRGIITDAGMRTDIEAIYAAGDCTESYDISCGQNRILALLPNAYRQGECAGINMAGGQCSFNNAIPMNAIGFFGLHIITAGSYEGSVYEKKTGDTYKKLFYKDGLLKGYMMVGKVDNAGIYTALIRNRLSIYEIDFDLICERPSLMAFSQKYRSEKLGGVV